MAAAAQAHRPAESGVVGRINALIAPIVNDAQLELVDVQYTREGQVWYLRIFIDKAGGVTIDDCQMISRECEVALDVEDIIRTQYILEVSSPGLDRPLKHKDDYTRFRDRLVKIRTFRAIDGQKNFIGYLGGLSDDPETHASLVTLRMTDQEVRIPYDMIASARLEIEF
jgi:ribosome maturation factor RimP